MPASSKPLLGAERPRVEWRPDFVRTRGGEAVALAEVFGLVLEPWQCEGLDLMCSVRADGQWACFEYAELLARQNGKTAQAMARALAGLFLFQERLILWSAHEYRTAMRSFKDLVALIGTRGKRTGPNSYDVGGVPVKVSRNSGEEAITRTDTGAEIKLVARSKGAGRGFSTDCMIVDEAFAYEDIHQDALLPTLTARPNPQIVYASSPPLTGRTGGPLYALRRRAEAAAVGGRDPGALGWRDWGVADVLDDVLMLPPLERAELLDDPARWQAANPALGHGRVSLESIARLRESMSDAGFGREVLGMWPAPTSSTSGWVVLAEDVWRSRGGAAERPSGPVALAVESAWPDGATSAVSVAGQHGAEVLTQVVAHYPGTGWVIPRVVEIAARHRPLAVVLDRRSPAGHLHDELADRLAALGVPLLTPQVQDVAAAAGALRAAVAGDAPFLRHYDQPELDEAVAAAERRPLGDAWAWARRGEVDISPLTSVTLAVWALLRAAPEPPAPVSVPANGAGWATADVARMGF